MQSAYRSLIGPLLVLAASLIACARHPADVAARNAAPAPTAPSAVPATAPPPPPALSHGFPIALGPPIPELASYFAQKPEVFDWQSLYLFHPQAPLERFRGFDAPLKGPFPGRKFARVFFHRFGADRSTDDLGVLDGSVAGCHETLIAADGRYCPSVSYPPIELSPAQIAELLAITNQRDKRQMVRMCGYRKDRGFVFVDDSGTPVAEIAIGLDCGHATTRPTDERLQHGHWDSPRWGRLYRLLAEFEPPSDSSDEFLELLGKQRIRDEHAIPEGRFVYAYLARHLPAYSSVDPRVREIDLSDEQRAIACAWQQLVWLSGSPRTNGGGSSIECDDGWKATTLDFVGCQREFPRCEAPIGEVEACMRHQRFDPCFNEPAARHCVALRSCLWGFRPPIERNGEYRFDCD
jgi:hypothetical protein